MKTTESESTLGNVNETKSSNKNSTSEMVTREKVKNSPLEIITYGDKHFLALGKYRLTEPHEDIKWVRQQSKIKTWDRIMQIIQIMIDQNKQQDFADKLEKEAKLRENDN